ncbi:MAG: FAD-dependent oxidoreductase, partial [Geobacteraceae bacterium]|nr:FAD-dependent oxidoreductase [Geobacteraceae bacterium]
MKQFGRIVMLMGLIALLLPSPRGLAAGETAVLAELHKAKQISCAECHGTSKKIIVDDSEKGVNLSCIGCHGSLDAVSAKAKGHINPHKSHLGQINCTACHSGHNSSQAYCLKCHSYTMPIPGAAAGVVAPVVPLKAKKSAKKQVETTDVVVIGAGAAGMTAAITAHDAGARVVLLEKQPITGGNSMLAAGGMNAAETTFQSAKGIKDSVELMYEDTMKGGKNTNDPALVRILAQNSAGSVAWLTSLGADISDVGRM